MKVSPAQSVKLESYIRQLESQGISRVSIQMEKSDLLYIKYVGEDVHSDHDGLSDILGPSVHCDLGQLH